MAVLNDWRFPAWETAVREALHQGLDGSSGPAPHGAFDAVFGALDPLLEGRDEIPVAIERWESLQTDGDRLSFTKPFTVTHAGADGFTRTMAAEVFGRFHDDDGWRGGCLLVRAADWKAFVATEGDSVLIFLRCGSNDGLWRGTLTHEVGLNPRIRNDPDGLATCGILDGGPCGPIVLLYERRRRPRWIRVDTDGPGCIIDLRELPALRDSARLLGDIARGNRPARDFFRGGLPLFGGDFTGTLSDTSDRRAVLCLALVMRTMVWKYESSG